MIVVNLIYLVVGFLDIYYKWWPTEYVQAVWVVILSAPLWIPMQRIVDMDPIWYEFKR
jgi:TRAP-type mannitol/chloroaromatic compound transport system permease large subunit